MGMSSEYINQIETGKLRPSLEFIANFCDYFKITVAEFFDGGVEYPVEYRALISDLNKLSREELGQITGFVKMLADKK